MNPYLSIARKVLAQSATPGINLPPAVSCPNCGCPIYHQNASGAVRCNLCWPKPEEAKLLIVVHEAGTTRWADYEVERAEQDRRRQARGG